jgi:hypothetical protein
VDAALLHFLLDVGSAVAAAVLVRLWERRHP